MDLWVATHSHYRRNAEVDINRLPGRSLSQNGCVRNTAPVPFREEFASSLRAMRHVLGGLPRCFSLVRCFTVPFVGGV